MRHLLVLILVACGSKQPAATPPGTPPARPARATAASDPYAARTWIDKLGDPRESERAVTELEQLGDPSAIPALGDAWLEQGRPPRLLQVIIGLARPLTPDEAKSTFMTDYEASGRPASWDKALPYLTRALTEVDEGNARSVDSAVKAAMGLGEAKQGLDALIELAQRPITKRLIAAQIAAIRAIAGFAGSADAPRALVRIIERDPPAHPRSATTKEQGRELEEKYALFLASVGASINALAELPAPSAALPLVLAMYRTPELFTQARRALVATGPAAKAELRKALRGESREVDAMFHARKLDRYCGERGDERCQRVSAQDFYAAVVLGDFHDPSVVPDLLAALKRPALPVYFIDGEASATTQHDGVFDAVRKIGAPTAAKQVHDSWAGRGRLQTRIAAVGAFPFVTRDSAGTAQLAAIAANHSADDSLRIEAATALARISTDAKDIATLDKLAKQYLDASAKEAKAAAALQAQVEGADQALDAARRALEAAKVALLETARDSASSTDQIKAATAAAKQAEASFRAAKQKHKDQTAPAKQHDSAAKAYAGYARMFQTHIARIEIAMRCKRDAACFAASLQQTPNDVAAHNARYIKDLASWSADDKRALVPAAIDRAMLELGKLGAAASDQTDALLAAVASDDRLIRGSILLALPKIAKSPCTKCEAKLDAAIKAGEGKSSIGDLNIETAVLRNYFAATP